MVTWSTRLLAVVALSSCGGPGGKTFIDPPIRGEVMVSPGQAVITWDKSSEQNSTLIVRTLGTVEATAPENSPQVGEEVGAGIVLANTEDERFVDNSLPESCGPFAWHLWARHADGTWAPTALTVRSLRGAHTRAPTAEVTELASAIEGGKLRVQWTPPEIGTNFKGVNVYRRVGSPATKPDEGTLVYSGAASAMVETLANLSPSDTTYFSVFNCNDCGKCGATAPSIGVAPVRDGGVTLDISNLTATVNGNDVELTWSSNAPRIKVLRKLNAEPSSINDAAAEVVFDGAGTSASEPVTKLIPHTPLNASVYTYRAWACVDALCSTTGVKTELRVTLKQALKAGGYTLFFRHGTANTCTDKTNLGNASNTTTPNWWKSCDANCSTGFAQQLTPPASDSELANVHTFFSTNGIAVSRVLSSEFCRAVKTAEGFDLGPPVIEETQALTYFVYAEATRCQDTVSLLGAQPQPGTNIVHVGHTQYATACANLDGLVTGEAAIFKPQLGAPPRFIARVIANEWVTLP
ncbi:MAG: hypothetical protein ACO1OB_11500 [Archangium sp.]